MRGVRVRGVMHRRSRFEPSRAPLACGRCGSEVETIDEAALARWEIGFELDDEPRAVVLCPDCRPVAADLVS
jgi:hypothetical protein